MLIPSPEMIMLSDDEKRILEEADRIRRRQDMERIESGGFYSEEEQPVVIPPEKPKKKHRFLRLVFTLILLAVLLAALLALYIYLKAGKTVYQPFKWFEEQAEWGLPGKGEMGVTNILLIGTDARASDEDSRSDAIMVASICPKQRKIYLTSILRDSYVTIPGYGQNRINHAYQMGGPTLLRETIELNFHIRIDHYLKVDFFSFIEIIDALGGVDIEVTDEEVHYVDAYLSEINHLLGVDPQDSFIYAGGQYHFSGKQALAYARIRYIGTDFGRTERQRTVINAAVSQAKKHPFSVLRASGKIFPALTTDMTDSELTLLILKAPVYSFWKTETGRVPIDGYWTNELTPSGQEVLGIDFEATSRILREMIYGK